MFDPSDMTDLAFMSNFSLELIVGICWIFLICEEILMLSSRGYTIGCYTFDNTWTEVWSIFKNGVSNTIVEGSIYRSTLVSITNHLPYFKELNAIVLFIMDFLFVPNSWNTNIGYSIGKLVIKTILGYYLVSMGNIVTSICFHILFTTSASFIVYGYRKLFWNGPSLAFGDMKLQDVKFELGKPPVLIDNVNNTFAQVPKLKRSNSLNDLRDYNYQPVYTLSEHKTVIPRDDLDEDLLESVDKFDKFIRDKEMDKSDNEVHKWCA